MIKVGTFLVCNPSTTSCTKWYTNPLRIRNSVSSYCTEITHLDEKQHAEMIRRKRKWNKNNVSQQMGNTLRQNACACNITMLYLLQGITINLQIISTKQNANNLKSNSPLAKGYRCSYKPQAAFRWRLLTVHVHDGSSSYCIRCGLPQVSTPNAELLLQAKPQLGPTLISPVSLAWVNPL